MKLRNKRKIKVKSKKFINSFKYAFEGLIMSFKAERNMKIHFFIMALVIIAGIYFNINEYEWIICVILFGVVISAELFNTAIEKIVDILIPYRDVKAKVVKDIAAGAVLLPAIASIIAGLIIFIPKILSRF